MVYVLAEYVGTKGVLYLGTWFTSHSHHKGLEIRAKHVKIMPATIPYVVDRLVDIVLLAKYVMNDVFYFSRKQWVSYQTRPKTSVYVSLSLSLPLSFSLVQSLFPPNNDSQDSKTFDPR